MRYRIAESLNDGKTESRRELVPAINNLIFVRSTQELVSELKQKNEVLEPLRYLMDRTARGQARGDYGWSVCGRDWRDKESEEV